MFDGNNSIEAFFVNDHAKEVHYRLSKAISQIRLINDPCEYDMVYGYPPLNMLKSVDTFNNESLITNKKVGIYIHIPFCTKACSYCYFIKTDRPDKSYVDEYIDALKKEIELYSYAINNARISFCYIGGGTPTYLEDRQLLDVISTINDKFIFSNNYEFTCEASPESLTKEKMRILKENGVTRVSLGIQSFDDTLTAAMNRAHDEKKSKSAIEIVSKYFPENFNVDIIYGYPEINSKSFFRDIEVCKSLNIPSITLYQLWMKCNNILKRKAGIINGDDILFQKIIANNYLTQRGYCRDKSDWYIKDKTAEFNFQTHKWENKFFYGIGLSSYAYVNGVYYRNESDSCKYVKKVNNRQFGIGYALKLSSDDILRRTCALGIKNNKGVNLKYLKSGDGSNEVKASLEAVFESLANSGLGMISNDVLMLTELGFLIPDLISRLFFSRKSIRSCSKHNSY